MYCKNCRDELDENTKFCSKCGYANDNEPLKTKSSIIKIMGEIIAGLAVVLIVMVVMALFSGESGTSNTQQETALKIVQEGSILSVPELNMKEVVENYWVDGTWSCFHGETESGAEALVVQYEKEKEGLIQFLVDLEQQNFVIGIIKDETNQIDGQSIMAIDLEGDMQSNPDLDHIKEVNKIYSKYGYDKISLKNIDLLDYIKGNAEDLLKNTGSLQEEDDIISDALNQLTIMTDQNEMTMITIQGNKEYSPTFAGVCIGDGDYKEKLKEENYLEKQGDDGATYYIDESGKAGIWLEVDDENEVEKINWMNDITEYTSFEENEEVKEEATIEVIQQSSTYIISDSSNRILNEGDYVNFSESELRYAMNEIYARHGRKFDNQELQTYFNQQSWYTGIISPNDFNEDMLSEVEKQNIQILNNALNRDNGSNEINPISGTYTLYLPNGLYNELKISQYRDLSVIDIPAGSVGGNCTLIYYMEKRADFCEGNLVKTGINEYDFFSTSTDLYLGHITIIDSNTLNFTGSKYEKTNGTYLS